AGGATARWRPGLGDREDPYFAVEVVDDTSRPGGDDPARTVDSHVQSGLLERRLVHSPHRPGSSVPAVGDHAQRAGDGGRHHAAITATSGGLSGSRTIQVVGWPLPVATVTVVPDTASLVVGQDSVSFRAELRDSTGRVTTERPVSWSTTDSTVIYIQPSYGGIQTFVRGLAAGSVFLRATSEDKTGQATVTVH